MIIQEIYEDDLLILKVTGDIDFQMMLSFREKILSVVKNNPQDLVIDLHGVNNIDSSALGLLLRLYKHQRQTGKQLTIKNPARHIEELLRFSSLSQSIA